MTSTAVSWEFFCVVVNEEGVVLQPLFIVAVSPRSNIFQLLREIQKFVVCSPHTRLWKPVTPISALLREDEIQALVANFLFQKPTEPPNNDHDALLLNPGHFISSHWESRPDLQYIHIILRDIQITSRIKRPRAEMESQSVINFQRLKSNFRNSAPSSLAVPASFQPVAQSTIALNRPFEPNTIPLALFDPAFGIFRDRCKVTPSDRALACLYELSVAGCQWHPSEPSRRDVIALILLKHLGLQLDPQTIANTDYTTDGNLSFTVMPALIRECKNESGYGLNQAIAYYGNFLVNALPDYWEYNTRFPSLLLVDVGTLVGFYGAVWDGTRVRVEPLTQWFDLTTPLKEKKSRYEMASILDALTETVKHIEDHYASISEQKDYELRRNYPFLSAYRNNEKDVGFIYHAQLQEDKLLFSATTDSNESIVVKFTSKYSVDAHQYMAQLGFAPKIRQCIPISADWLAIVMDWSNYTSLYDLGSRLSELQRVKVQSRVLHIVQELHRGPFVHGDIRDANFLVDTASLADDVVRVHLIDYDWSGRNGEARYPHGLNYKTVKRPEEVISGGIITVGHDIDMVSYLFER